MFNSINSLYTDDPLPIGYLWRAALRPTRRNRKVFSKLWVAISNLESNVGGVDSPINSKAALLQALIQKDGYGLDLIDRVRERTNGDVKLHQGSVYPALRELESEGLVRSYESEPLPERGGRPRRYYQLTAAGQRAAYKQAETVLAFFALPEPA
jgi:PadR family transcriptional regulator, regulatory protein PadR